MPASSAWFDPLASRMPLSTPARLPYVARRRPVPDMRRLFGSLPVRLQSIARLVAGSVALVSSAAVAAPDFQVDTATLSNGMEIAVVSDHRAPIVSQLLYYRAGSADEHDGNRGIAHILEHMMFQGTSTVPGQEYRDTIARFGGRENAFTSADTTSYWQTVGREALEVVMRLEADRMQNLVIDEESFLREVEVVKEERRSRYETSPQGPFGEAMDAAAYLAHPYRYPIIGYMHHIEAFTIDEARDWYDRWYSPANAILVIAGDTTLAEVLPLAEKYYGVIPAGVAQTRDRAVEPPQLAERRVIVRDERVRQPSFGRSYLAPSRTARDGMAPALTIAADILSGSTGPLYQGLVVDQGIAAAAGAYYSGNARDWGRFGVWMSPNRDSDVAVMESAMDALLEQILEDGVSAEDVARAQNTVNSAMIFARDSVTRLARRVGGGLSVGLTVEEITGWTDEINAVTVDDVNAALRQVLDQRKSVTGLLLPAEDKSL